MVHASLIPFHKEIIINATFNLKYCIDEVNTATIASTVLRFLLPHHQLSFWRMYLVLMEYLTIFYCYVSIIQLQFFLQLFIKTLVVRSPSPSTPTSDGNHSIWNYIITWDGYMDDVKAKIKCIVCLKRHT